MMLLDVCNRRTALFTHIHAIVKCGSKVPYVGCTRRGASSFGYWHHLMTYKHPFVSNSTGFDPAVLAHQRPEVGAHHIAHEKRPPAAMVEDRTKSRSGRGQADVERDDLQCWLLKRARLYMFSARARPMWGPMCD